MSAKKTQPPTRIVKRGTGHSYLLDGEKAPGVTTILGAGVPKPWLAPWAARTISEYVMDRIHHRDGHYTADELVNDLRTYNAASTYPKKLGDTFSRVGLSEILKTVHYGERDRAANRGTQVHGLAERLSRGEEIDVPEELEGHVDSYLRFLDEWQPANALLERVIINRTYRYMGKLDMICDIGGETVLLDVKTNRKEPYDEVALQLAGYRYGEAMLSDDGQTEEPMPEIAWCGVVWVRADGYDVYRYDTSIDVFRAFLYVQQVGEWFADGGPASRVRSEALRPPRPQ